MVTSLKRLGKVQEVASFYFPMTEIPRRDFLKGAAAFCAVGAFGGTLYGLTKSEARPQNAAPAAIVVRDRDTEETTEVTASMLRELVDEKTTTLQAEWDFVPAIVYLVDPEVLEASSKLRGIDTAQFAISLPGTEKLLLAYNGKCKHLGCTVGWAEDLGASADIPDYTGDGVKEGRVLCPCHHAQYDIYDLGTQLPNGPAPEPLDVVKIRWNGDVLEGVRGIAQTHPHDANGK